jgi:hypothetical protein
MNVGELPQELPGISVKAAHLAVGPSSNQALEGKVDAGRNATVANRAFAQD